MILHSLRHHGEHCNLNLSNRDFHPPSSGVVLMVCDQTEPLKGQLWSCWSNASSKVAPHEQVTLEFEASIEKVETWVGTELPDGTILNTLIQF